MSLAVYLAFVLASTLLIIAPGPVVTLIIGNALAHGLKPALLNVIGSTFGLCGILALVALGLGQVAAEFSGAFEALRFVGAAYLLYLGARALLRRSAAAEEQKPVPPAHGFFLQGLMVSLSNPKTLLFFGAFLPQFIDAGSPYLPQVLLLGATFAVLAGLSDSIYAVMASRARAHLALKHRVLMDRIGGVMLLGGGLWLLARRG
jgi:threonine/homoserine/homoserine lactone efflux protein